jgi:hypothetical protein
MATETIKTIEYRWLDETDGKTYTADVVIGDGQTMYDENYPLDERIWFYFTDEAGFEECKSETSGEDFIIVSVIE